MPPEAGSPEAWLRYAHSDLRLAQQPPAEGVLWETVCFHAQQAVERSIKAVLVHHGIGFPRTHSIERLIDLLPPTVRRPPELIASAGLTAYATALRYPGEQEPVSEAQFREALRLAEAVVAWAQEHLLPNEAP